MFKIIAIRTLDATPCLSYAYLCTVVKSMQKTFFRDNTWKYFYQGFHLDAEGMRLEVEPTAFNDSVLFARATAMKSPKTQISIGAIVGKNGTGKSTIVETMIRIINNLSAATFGEYANYAAAEHLHYIDHVYAEMCYTVGAHYFVLSVQGRKITLRELEQETDGVYAVKTVNVILDGCCTDGFEPLGRNPISETLCESFFYTIICNYSMYAYNYRDYAQEQTPDQRIMLIEGKNINEVPVENRFWISGLFHKNDGYQTPVVLNPWRSGGNLDVAKENHLAMERLINLVFFKDDITRESPFREINQKLKIVALFLPPLERKPFSKKNMLKSLFGDDYQTKKLYTIFEEVYDFILGYWKKKYELDELAEEGTLKDAQDYIVYKTLKISKTYLQHHDLLASLDSYNPDYGEAERALNGMLEDHTHKTAKLRRAICHHKYRIYSYVGNDQVRPTLKELDEAIHNVLTDYNENGGPVYIDQDDLLPPPLFDYNLGIEEGVDNVVPFTGLSTGERQVCYTISNIMYHLININSEWKAKHEEGSLLYKYVNVVLDEVELYFHPELQRNFVNLLLSAMSSVNLMNIEGVNFTMVSHSPFVISDLPNTNIMFLGDDKERIKTFGANIYDLLDSSFFMDSSIGEVARKEVEMLVNTYKMEDKEMRQRLYKENKYRFHYLKEILGEEYLLHYVSKYLDEMDKEYTDSQ